MIFIVVVAGGVGLFAVVHLLVGWRISSGLYDGALAIKERPKDLGVRVRLVSRGQIVLEAPDARQDIGHPGTLGLAWDGGYGRVGDVVAVADGRITREWELTDDSPPACEGPLEACPPIELEGYAYPNDPSDRGLEFEETTFNGPLGALGAWTVPGGDAARWAILCHGWTAERRELLRMLPAFHETGFNSLVINYRNDPGMPVDPTDRHRFGLSEWADLEAAVRTVIDQGAESIVLMGCSTGAALIMRFLESSGHASDVDAIVFDSPNIVLADTFRHAIDVPRATPLMFEFGLWMADWRWKVDWEATNFVDRSPTTLTVPTLVFHGTSDRTVPISESRQLAARASDVTQLVETPAAGHVMSWNADPERYERYLRSFLSGV